MAGNNKNKNKAFKVFDLIAPIYGLFYNYQKKFYTTALDRLQKELDLSIYKTIIDVGCGTGALSSVLNQREFAVTGVDQVLKMINIAKKKPENKEIEFIRANALEGLPFNDKSFDISFASYVIHGLKEDERKVMYREMSRITKEMVIFYDYNENKSILTNIAEWLEGGDYFNFIRNVKYEMKENFKEVQIMEVGLRAAWYICVPND